MTHLEEVQYLRSNPDGVHYNCAQSLLIPFAQEVGLTKEQAHALGSCFGSGMLHGSACGALSAALMLAGMKGYDTKTATTLIQNFRNAHRATDCTTLLTFAKEENVPKKQHCDDLVLEMAEQLENLFTQN